MKTELKDTDEYFGIYSISEISKDEIIFKAEHVKILKSPTQYSVQVDTFRHIEVPERNNITGDSEFLWQFMNHACEPNCYFNTEDMTFRAKHKIEKGEHLTFNYLTTEHDMVAPFKCNCKSENCFGFIKGFKYLNDEQKLKLIDSCAKHLKRLYKNHFEKTLI
ncbi:MAG: SET domain-containing protein-lysine N-methyltransferase [Bacteroidales bacterium]|nr:SET domain-containing protein-lysine N-methyltransferase [Bacteroidales bacterium]